MAESPSHYTRGAIEVWDFIRDQDLNYHLGNSIKYICRAGFKDDNSKIADLKKAIHYLENEILHSFQPNDNGGVIPLHVPTEEWSESEEYSKSFDR